MVAYVSAQSCNAAANSGTAISSYSVTGSAVSNGNTICVFAAAISQTNGNPFSWVITDNASNTYSAEGKATDANGMGYIWFFCGSSSGSPTSFTLDGGGDTFIYSVILVDTFSGLNTGAGYGVGNNSQFNPGSGTDAISCTAETTVSNGALIWCACLVDDNTTPGIVPGTGFTAAQSETTAYPQLFSEYKIGSGFNTSLATWTDATAGATGNNYYSTGSIEFIAATSSIYLPRPMRTIYVPDYRIKRR